VDKEGYVPEELRFVLNIADEENKFKSDSGFSESLLNSLLESFIS